MTISSSVSVITYEGNGVTRDFPFPFLVLRADDLDIILTRENGETTQITHNFKTSGVGHGQGGVVHYPEEGAAISAGQKVTLRRHMQIEQPTDLTNQGGFYPEILEKALDRQAMISQQLAEELGRAYKVPVTSNARPDDLLGDVRAAVRDADASATAAAHAANGAASAAALNATALVDVKLQGYVSEGAASADRAAAEASTARTEAERAKTYAEGAAASEGAAIASAHGAADSAAAAAHSAQEARGAADGGLVQVGPGDVSGFLAGKLLAGPGITLTQQTDGDRSTMVVHTTVDPIAASLVFGG